MLTFQGTPANGAVEAAPGYPGRDSVPVRDMDMLSDTTQGAGSPVPQTAPAAIPLQAPGAAASPDSETASRPEAEGGAIADSGALANPAAKSGPATEKGLILNAETGKPVSQANVILVGEKERHSAKSDADGLYSLSGLRPGVYRLKVGKKGFAVYEREGLEYRGGMPLREIRLDRSVLKGQTIEAKGGNNAGSSASMLASRRSSSGVMEGVGAEQMGKSTDGDAGAVAKRISGTSLVGGKYIYVRGLGERYTNMTLNGLPVPSPEKDKRVVPQDLFPASALDRFVLYKTFTPELYGDFAGGSVALETKGIPEKRFLKISSGMGGTDYSGDASFLNFGQDRLSYDGGNTFWGFDDGTRSLPDGVPGVVPIREDRDIPRYKQLGLPAPTRLERAAYAVAFSNTYAVDTAKVHPNQGWSLSFGDVRYSGESNRAGFIFSAGFKNKYNQKARRLTLLGSVPIRQSVTEYIPVLDTTVTRKVDLNDTLPEMETVQRNGKDTLVNKRATVVRLAPGINRDVRSGTYEATATALLNFGWEINEDNRIFWKNFYANIGTDEASFTRSVADGSGALSQDRPVEERYLLEFNRRSLMTSQLGGGHYLGYGLIDSTSWAAGYSRTRGETPDSRKYLYARESDSSPSFENANNDVWGTRIYEDVGETALAGRLDGLLSIPPEWSARDTFLTEGRWFSRLRLPEARAGVSGNIRNRAFDVTRYSYDKDRLIYTNVELEQIREPKALKAKIEQGVPGFDFWTSPKDYDEYGAKEGTYAGYLTARSGLSLYRLPLDFDAGLRMEGYSLSFIAPFTGVDLGEDKRAIDSAARRIEKDEIDWLPSVGLTAHPYANGKIHIHFATTLTRPEFREIAPFRFTEYLTSRDVYGNPGLRKTTVRHYDVRWEWFLPGNQLLSVSLFDKLFTDPIEVVADVDKRQSYQNARSAYVRGVEFEGSLDVEYALGAAGLPVSLLKGFTLYGNLALMRSKVALDTAKGTGSDIGAGDLTSRSRAMVGQSPYLLNFKLTHEREWRRIGALNALLFNVAGSRIKEAGVAGAPDIYERPFPGLDYLGRLSFFKTVEVSWTVKNLLESRKRFTGYEYNQGRTYHTVSPETIRQSFAGLPASYDTEVTAEGTSYEVKVGYGF